MTLLGRNIFGTRELIAYSHSQDDPRFTHLHKGSLITRGRNTLHERMAYNPGKHGPLALTILNRRDSEGHPKVGDMPPVMDPEGAVAEYRVPRLTDAGDRRG